MSILENNDSEKKLEPLSKEEALESIRKFRKDFHLTNVHVNKEHVLGILKKAGSISDTINESRCE